MKSPIGRAVGSRSLVGGSSFPSIGNTEKSLCCYREAATNVLNIAALSLAQYRPDQRKASSQLIDCVRERSIGKAQGNLSTMRGGFCW